MAQHPKLEFSWLLNLVGLLAILLPVHSFGYEVWLVHTPLVGEYNSLLAVAKKMVPESQIRTLTSEVISNQSLTPSSEPVVIFHALAKRNEVDAILDFKMHFSNQVRVINFYDPHHRYEEFDLIVNPSHLDMPPRGHVLDVIGVPSPVTDQKLKEGINTFTAEIAGLPGPFIAVTIGGSTKSASFETRHAIAYGKILAEIQSKSGATLLITNSRRTTPEVQQGVLEQLKQPYRFYDWNLTPNPYLGILAHADHIIVTGDSMSMIADGIQTGKPIHVFAAEGTVEPRHKRFILDLFGRNQIRPLNSALNSWTYTPIGTAQSIATSISNLMEEDCISLFRVKKEIEK